MPSRTAMVFRASVVVPMFLVLLALVQLSAQPARASHYNLDRVDLVTAAERRALSRAGILDTKVLLAWTASSGRRAWVADKTGLSTERLSELARLCDLMRVDGIGPSIAAVLLKAGADDTRALAASDPSTLLDRMKVVSRGTSMHQKMPDRDTVRVWIASAKRLRPILDGLDGLDGPDGH